ncbi:hypothetical protein D3C71_1497890 [compost metagenome]
MDLQQAASAQPSPEQRKDGKSHAGQPRLFTADPVRKNAHWNPEQRAAKDGNGDHRSFLGIRKSEILRNVERKSTAHDPNHKADVKVQESGQ